MDIGEDYALFFRYCPSSVSLIPFTERSNSFTPSSCSIAISGGNHYDNKEKALALIGHICNRRYRSGKAVSCRGIHSAYEEPTGQAKITAAYNLPCDHVIHTVGPIVQGELTEKHCELLESCYNSCLEIAVKNGVKSIAFCCISTGVFGFPKKEAAEIAVSTVREYTKSHDIKVIFNVFGDDDYGIYRKLLG